MKVYMEVKYVHTWGFKTHMAVKIAYNKLESVHEGKIYVHDQLIRS